MQEKFIPIVSGTVDAKVRIREIIFIERNRRKLHVVTTERKYEFYEKIENVIPYLDERFFPCLKGCYINFDRVVRMEQQKIYFDNGEIYYLGRENFFKTRRAYKEYLKNLNQ